MFLFTDHKFCDLFATKNSRKLSHLPNIFVNFFQKEKRVVDCNAKATNQERCRCDLKFKPISTDSAMWFKSSFSILSQMPV